MPAYNLVSENLPVGLAKHPDLDVPWVLKEGGFQAAGSGVLLEKHSGLLRAKNQGPDRPGFKSQPNHLLEVGL